tara:strand:+ start:339 stop:515 length:177 start_codon:yes stop_codon:yes gene_type:complete
MRPEWIRERVADLDGRNALGLYQEVLEAIADGRIGSIKAAKECAAEACRARYLPLFEE